MISLKMAVVCKTIGLSVNVFHVRSILANNNVYQRLLPCAGVPGTYRGVHTQQLTKNMRYITNHRLELTLDPKTMKLNKELDRPLSILMTWMGAKNQHVMKYAQLYLEQGYDVVSVSCTAWQLMWPLKGSQVVAKEVMDFMAQNDNRGPLVVHGFSVGAYVWGEMLVHAVNQPHKYQPVLDRISAQMWDSSADIGEMTIGLPRALSPKNMVVQKTLKAYIEYHMEKFYEVATKHYYRASEVFHSSPCRAPALFLVSKTDPVGSEKRSRHACESWTRLGTECTWQCWEDSPHVLHFMKYPEQYREAVYNHLHTYGLLPAAEPAKIKMKAAL